MLAPSTERVVQHSAHIDFVGAFARMVIPCSTIVNYFGQRHEICQLGNVLDSLLRVNVGRPKNLRLDNRKHLFCEVMQECIGSGLTGVASVAGIMTGVKILVLINCLSDSRRCVLPKDFFASLIDYEDFLL